MQVLDLQAKTVKAMARRKNESKINLTFSSRWRVIMGPLVEAAAPLGFVLLFL